ncbi:unnamed protein product [Closterium sp. NIES-53]
MYLMTCTRPDLAYPLSILARYVAPGRHRPEQVAAAKRVLRYLCSTSGMGLVLGGRCPVVLTGHADASWADDQATQRSSQGYTFSLGSGSVSWQSTRSSSVLSSSCEAETYAGAMAAQELRWLTYLLTDLGEQPRSPPVLYVDNKAMLALCREHRLEHRTKHIALRYFLARELQQRGQLRLAYVASEANTADIFTKALAPGDHQRFCTVLACFALLDWSCDLLFSPTLPMGVFLLVPNSFASSFIPVSSHNDAALHDVVVAAHENGWMDALGNVWWLDEGVKPFIEPWFGVHARSAMFVLDSYRGHLTDDVKAKFKELNILPAKPPPEVVLRWISLAWKAVPTDLIKRAFLTCDISNALDGSDDKLAMAHTRSKLTVVLDVDDEVAADGF